LVQYTFSYKAAGKRSLEIIEQACTTQKDRRTTLST